MFNLPKGTIVHKVIPKQKIYDNAKVPKTLKDSFVQDVDKIIWANKISNDVIKNIDSTDSIMKEIEIFHIILRKKKFNYDILKLIDISIPQYIVYVMEFEGEQQLWCAYKEQCRNATNIDNKKCNVIKYFHNDWERKQKITLKGNTLELILTNILQQISNNSQFSKNSISLKEKIANIIKIENFNKEICSIMREINNVKQVNIGFELNRCIKKLKRQIEDINNIQ